MEVLSGCVAVCEPFHFGGDILPIVEERYKDDPSSGGSGGNLRSQIALASIPCGCATFQPFWKRMT